ncbi:hypothetical protein NQZ79_g5364 [Umbelopsis isabellina]|nr:hypothetical protein NQZ79_g5364 [Umbelopsis isabellina]
MSVVATSGTDLRRKPSKASIRNWWKRMTNKNQTAPYPGHMPPRNHKHGIFGVALPQSIRYARANISYLDDESGERLTGYIPIIVAKCGSYLKEEEGIFRLSGSAKRVKALQDIFDSVDDQWGAALQWDDYTVHDAANIMRRFLNFLPNPVITHQYYQAFRDVMNDKTSMTTNERITAFQTLIQKLPLPHQFLLLYLLDMLSLFAQHEEINLMGASNLAAVFTPGMLSHPSHDLDPVQYKISQRVVEFLIEFHMCFNMPHANALHKDPVVYPSAITISLPTSEVPQQAIAAPPSEQLNQRPSMSSMNSEQSVRTIRQIKFSASDSAAASFVTPDNLSASVASSYMHAVDELPIIQADTSSTNGSQTSSVKSHVSSDNMEQVTSKATSAEVDALDVIAEAPETPVMHENVERPLADVTKNLFAVHQRFGVSALHIIMLLTFGTIFGYEVYQFFGGRAVESTVFFGSISGYLLILLFGIESPKEATPSVTPDIEEKTLVEDHKIYIPARTSIGSASSLYFESPMTQEGSQDWKNFKHMSSGADSGYGTLSGSRDFQKSEYQSANAFDPTSIKNVFRDSEGRYIPNNLPYPVITGAMAKPDEADMSVADVSDDESEEYEDECSSIWLFDNASVAEDQAAERAMLQDKEIMAEWRDLLTRSWKTDIGHGSPSQKKVAFVPSSENSLIEDAEASSIATISSRFNEEIQDDPISQTSQDDSNSIADDIDPDQLYRMWDRIQQQITEDERLAMKLQQEEEEAEARRKLRNDTLNPFLAGNDMPGIGSTETTPRPNPPPHKN